MQFIEEVITNPLCITKNPGEKIVRSNKRKQKKTGSPWHRIQFKTHTSTQNNFLTNIYYETVRILKSSFVSGTLPCPNFRYTV